MRLYRYLCLSTILLFSWTVMAKSKQYEVVINHEVQAGTMHLKAGKYQLEVDGGTATFFQRDKEVCKVAVKAEEGSKKVEVTRLAIVDDKVAAIELGGTKTKLTLQ